MPGHGLVTDNTHKSPFFIHDSDLVKVVGKHQSTRLEQRSGLCDCKRRKIHQLLCRDAMHPSNVAVDFLSCDDFQHIYSVNSSLRRTFVIDDKHVIPVVRCQVVDNISHRCIIPDPMCFKHGFPASNGACCFSALLWRHPRHDFFGQLPWFALRH